MNNIYFTICSLVYVVLLQFVIYKKRNKKDHANHVYLWLVDFSTFGVLFELLSYFILNILNFEPTSIAFLNSVKLIIMFFMAWILCFTLYIWVVTDDNEKNKKRFHRGSVTILLIYLLLVLFVIFTPLTIIDLGNGKYNVDGISIFLSLLLTHICVISMILTIIFSKCNLKSQRIIPIYCFMTLALFVVIVQKMLPGQYLLTSLVIYTTFIIYFTLENPDLKVTEEFSKTRDDAKVSVYEKEIFLFNILHGIREPVENIRETCTELSKMELNQEVSKGIRYLDNVSKKTYDLLNEMIDITNIEACNIKVYKTKYNILRLIDQIVMTYSNNTKDDVKFKINISKKIPEFLYGDSIRLKQVIKILLENSCKYTNNGTITFSIKSIVKLNNCRLIIKLTDTGVGMTTYEQNVVFNKENEKNGNKLVDETRNNLAIAKTITNVLGGLLIVSSELDKGSTFTLILDQKIEKQISD